jgi:eukaryotic-like serine/threonine-protein kinase
MIGQTVSHYRIVEKLGEGGMGVVYKAQDLQLDRFVALKFLPSHVSSDEETKLRFMQEAKAAAALNHPHICTIHGVEENHSTIFIVMEYVDGSTIRTKLEHGPLKFDDAVKYGIQIGEALQEAHGKGIVHRDIKADNIILNSKGQAKVMDFGLAKIKGVMKLTKTSSTVGTLGYMSPEQIQGGEVDARSDIFACAILFFEMLTGRLPFRGEHEAAMVYSIVNEDPEQIQKYLPEIPPAIVNILDKALEKDPEDRYQHIQDMVVDLRRSKKDTSRVARVSAANHKHSQPDSGPQKTEVRSSKKKMWISFGSLAVLLIAGALYYFLSAANFSAPLPPMKTIRLTSFDGEERDPALSPDGKSIAFSWNGEHQDNFDIYVKLVDAGIPVRLTTNALVDDQPIWSPDGRYIAFIRVVGVKQNDKPREIFVIPAFGGREQKIAEYFPGLTEHPSICWSRDNKSIYFTKWSAQDTGFVIYKVSVETKDIEQVTHLPRGTWGDQNSGISPDGKYLAFVRRRDPLFGDLYVKNLIDNTVQRITNLETWFDGFSWGTDSHSILFSSNFDGSSSLWKASLSGSKPEKIISGININNPSISVYGNRLVYAETIENANIWKIDLQNKGKETPLISSSTFCNINPNISPDGKKIIFSSDRTGSHNIWICETDGTNPTQRTYFDNNNFGSVCKWSYDGTEIVLTHGNNNYILRASGGTPQFSGSFKFPIWSEDGLGFYGNKYPDNQIYYYSRDGQSQRQITKGHGIMPRLYGDDLYYVKDWDHKEIWKIPLKGGNEEPVLQSVPDLLISQWVVVKKGIYYIRDNKGSPSLDFYSFLTKQKSPIKLLPQLFVDGFTKIEIAPDESYVLYSKREPTKSDIILVDNFR